MQKAKTIKITHRNDVNIILYEGNADTLKDLVIKAIVNRADLRAADLRAADLRYANLRAADLRDADQKELTSTEYLIIRDEFRELFPDVPVVTNLDQQICEIVTSGKGALEMSIWHTCDTTHCRAGWAIHLAGKAGYELEAKLNSDSERAGALIYRVSTGRHPDFFANNKNALADICKWGAIEAEESARA